MATQQAEDDGDDYYVVDDQDVLSDEELREEKIKEEKLKILVLGKHGSGKTTLVKSFLDSHQGDDSGGDGLKTANEDSASASPLLNVYSTVMCGVLLEFYDSPGLGDPKATSDKKLLQQINNEVPDGFNLVLICIRMDQEIDQSLVNALLEVSNVYGTALWERTIFVLTFANVYSGSLQKTAAKGDAGLSMTQHVEELVSLLHKQLVKDPRWLYSVKESVFRDIPFCMAGTAGSGPKDRVLPTTQDWVQDLLLACMSQSTSESVAAAKLNKDKKRLLIEAGTVGSSAVIGGAAGAFVGGTVGTVIFPGVGTVLGAGIGSLIGGGVGTVTGGGSVVGMRIADHKKATAMASSATDQNDTVMNQKTNDAGSSTDRLLDHGKQLLARVKSKMKKQS